MSRFYQSGKPDFVDNFMYTPPWELAQQALAYNDAGIGKTLETASLFDNINVDYIPDPVEKAIVEKELKNYSDKADEYSTNMQLQLQNSPQSWKKYIPQLQALGTDLSKNMKTGNLAKIKQSAAALAKWKEENKKVKEENPELYERGLAHYINEWRKNPNRSLDAIFSGDQLVNFDITSKEFLDALGQFKASLQQREDGMYFLNNKSVGEKEVEEAYLGLALSSPKGKAYLQQMAKFKAPGFYDEKTGGPEPLYVASDINGNQIPIEGLKEQQQNWYKLSDGMKNITPFPTKHLNPRHAWAGAIEAGKKIFGFSEITKTEDPVKAKAMDRQHDFNMESVKHRNRMSEKAQDHANKMIQLERLAQIKGNQSAEGKANGAAKADALTEGSNLGASLDADQKDGKGGRVGMSGNLADLRKLKNSGGAIAKNAELALDRILAETMNDLGYNVKFQTDGNKIIGNHVDRIAYEEFRKTFYSNIPDNKKAGIATTNIENRLLKEGLIEKKGSFLAATKKGIEKGLIPKNPTFNDIVASYEMGPGYTNENVLGYGNYISKLAPISGDVITKMDKKIKNNFSGIVKQSPIQFSSAGLERASSTINNGKANFTYRTSDGKTLKPEEIVDVKATEGVYGAVIDFNAGRDIEGVRGIVKLKDNRKLENVTIVGNSDNVWGGKDSDKSLFDDENNFDPVTYPLVKRLKENQLKNDIEINAQRFVGGIGSGQNSSQPMQVFYKGKPLDYFVDSSNGDLKYYLYDKKTQKKVGEPYDSSEDFTGALLDFYALPEIQNMYK